MFKAKVEVKIEAKVKAGNWGV